MLKRSAEKVILLESDRWAVLQHAYGAASDIPSLLRSIYTNPYTDDDSEREGVWFELWSSLCHQGDVYSASIAAVPHLIQAGLGAIDGTPAYGLLQLPVAIEVSRLKRPHQIRTEEIEDDYWISILKLEAVCEIALKHSEDKNLMTSVRDANNLLVGRAGRPLPNQKTESELGELFIR